MLVLRLDNLAVHPKLKASQVEAPQRGKSVPLPPDGKSHTWRIEYGPQADGGQGRLTVWLDEH